MNEPNKPWTWNEPDPPHQPAKHPIDQHPAGTRFLACGYDAELKPFGQGDWVRYADYATIIESLQMANEEIRSLEEQIKVIKLAAREEMDDLKRYYENERR
jgi:hypothetical protein